MSRLYIILVNLCFLLITTDQIFDLTLVTDPAQAALQPLSQGLYSVASRVSVVIQFVGNIPTVYRQNLVLQDEIVQLNNRLVDYQQLQQENLALKAQLGVERLPESKLVLASVLGSTEYGASVVLVIDKGQRDGVEPGAVVVSKNLLIGLVQETEWRHSVILPIFAVDSKVPVQVLANQSIQGIAKGHFNQQVLLTEVLQEHAFQVHDLVVTSGEGGIYPPGLMIGRIKTIQSVESEIFQAAVLEPFWRIGDLHTVFVLAE